MLRTRICKAINFKRLVITKKNTIFAHMLEVSDSNSVGNGAGNAVTL